jgi:23S rRNA (uracil1939-C5)-methyltransferase
MSRKNQRKERIILENITIEKAVSQGKCLSHYGEAVVFVEGNIAPNDVVDLEVFKRKKNYWEARAIKFHSESELREKPFCEHYGVCGGCKWQHLSYETQLKFKQQEVVDALERIAKVPIPVINLILASAKTKFYRNKLEFTFSNNRWLTAAEMQRDEDNNVIENTVFDKNALGFHIPERFDKIVDVTHCSLQTELSNEIRNSVRVYAKENQLTFFDLRNQVGFLRNLVIRTATTQDLMVIVIVAESNMIEIEKIMSFLQAQFPQITSLQYIINTKKNDSYHDLEPVVFAGNAFIVEEMEGLKFQVNAKAFYQTNPEQAYNLYKIARQYADLQGDEIVYDLYTGTGTIANFVAKKAKKVIGLEYVSEAVKDARINSKLNELENTEFFSGDMKDILNDEFIKTHGKPDVLITDPPRAGMHDDVIKVILNAEPQRIVYVSCNPATQARDIALLAEKYIVTDIQPVDMFPHTFHVENVVKLIRIS